ncbi:hypothetical protein [Anabaena sp. UHCC 0451]|uniref:hypothetical protein n=1 Tax=Anabaena sp. UHCC 0451 TaxID=2055235 RepID=UPI002B1F66E5|nr:hypothetical protein [Anabaena sp. UHCC 0451]MEA5577989.1 hypothetical protein [Anabaena sp. UHCC 0451]
MEHWQFLIQKQGDRDWQPLESPNLRISAGKYRVLARSHLLNTDIEVRVIHSSIQEVPPKRRIFKRLRRTNADGLMAVIPFTDLKPGIWELRCSGDLMMDMLGKSWQHSLILKVLPSELNEQPLLGAGDQADNGIELTLTKEDESVVILPNNLDIHALSTETEEERIINQPVNPVLFKGETAEQIVQSLIDLALPSSESWDAAIDDDISPLSSPLPLKLSLERDTYVASWGKTLTVNGSVELAETEHLQDAILSTTNLDQLQLVTELRSPSESKIFTQFKESLIDQILPFTFSSIIAIPRECESKLILANMSLYGAVSNGAEVILLGNYSFIITADVTELLTITSQQSHLNLLPDNSSPTQDEATEVEAPVSVGLELFNLVKTPKLAQFHILKPGANKPLPPRIKPIIILDGFSPALPKLPRIHKNALSASDVAITGNSEGNVNISSPVPPINLEKLAIKQVKTSFPYLKRLKPTPEPALEPKENLANTLEIQLSEPENQPELLPNYEHEELITAEITINKTEASPLIQKWMKTQGYLGDEGIELVDQNNDMDNDQSTQELPLTLNDENPVVEDELLLSLDAEIEEVIDVPEHMRLDTLDTIEPTPEPELSENISNLWSQEIVLDDTYVILSKEENHQPPELQEEELVDLSPPLLTSLPTPQLFLPNGELLAGTSIKVRLELSQASSTVVVKLWVEDYQTRGLLDGPHQIQDLRPTPWGNWEAITQLIVPLGCVEILVGAIALDLTTQQESHKVTVVKTVIPPDLPVMELDEMLGM